PPATDSEVAMTALTRFVLRHKALVALFWVAVTAAGIATISGTTHRMTNTFAMPGQAFKTGNQIAREYGNGDPYVAVLTAPAGQRVTGTTGRVFATLATAIPHVRIADYATTHNRAFVTRDGRTTFALVYTPAASGFGGSNAGARIGRGLTAAAR